MGPKNFLQDIKDKVSTLRSDRYCRLCGARPKEFLWGGFDIEVLRTCRVSGAGWRSEAACPKCRSSDRERLVFEYLKRCTNVGRAPLSLLHIAPEYNLGRILSSIENLEYVSCDLGSGGIDVKADVMALPFPENSFDVIICNHVLEHVRSDSAALTELHRVMKRKAFAIVQVPLALANAVTIEEKEDEQLTPDERERRFGQNDHVRLYGHDYRSRLSAAAFEVEVWNFVEHHTPRVAKHLGIKGEEDVYCIRKC